ncbi:hypothetical protein FGADI_5830 [Fusarium gaditjirri]|uniref:Uncharacterized protein n=1 Tax=Fusarium gaditjirri TaxID=282569 RepID=A0A8H4T901_9HYPO|nr:hypothetical protein FGADI_5830 [Fusarium gaditjirri]
MDPFHNLPAEIRIQILGSIPSYATTARLIRVSPSMLAQYRTTESENMKEYLSILVGTNMDGHGTLQDALAIIYLSLADHEDQICNVVLDWEAKTLPLPFSRGEDEIVTKLRLLFEPMNEFIDDYLNKAMVQNTVEAYLQPPRGTYIDTVDPQRITLHDLNSQERLRLFQAFIKFEVLCKLSSKRVDSAQATLPLKLVPPELNRREKKALVCVYEYMRDSYSAIFAQCAGAQTFKDYKKTCDDLGRNKRQSNGTDTEANQVVKTQRTIYQQRAWVFFDNARFCPGQEAHFPTEEEIKVEITRLKNERMMEMRKQWGEYFAKRRPNPPFYKHFAQRHDSTAAKKLEISWKASDRSLIAPPFFAVRNVGQVIVEKPEAPQIRPTADWLTAWLTTRLTGLWENTTGL